MSHHSPTADRARLRRVQTGARATLTLGIGASLAANMLAANPTIAGRIIAAWSPVALLLTVELLSRVPTAGGWLSRLRVAAAAAIAGIAAWVSYWHMAEVATSYGEATVAAHLLPFSVDGLVIVASVCLMEISNRLNDLTASETIESAPETTAEIDKPAEQTAPVTAGDRSSSERRPSARPVPAAAATDRFPSLDRSPAEEPSAPASVSQPNGSRGSAGPRVAAYLAEHPEAKQVEIAEALGITTKTVGRTEAWKNRHQLDPQASQEVAA